MEIFFGSVSKTMIVFIFVYLFMHADAQFWKLKALTERDMFILETKASMASGICYKQVDSDSNDPELRKQTLSYCCAGYQKKKDTSVMSCEPICNEDCMQGICTAPDTCECYPGFERVGGRCEEL